MNHLFLSLPLLQQACFLIGIADAPVRKKIIQWEWKRNQKSISN